jgi:hypothetical protein
MQTTPQQIPITVVPAEHARFKVALCKQQDGDLTRLLAGLLQLPPLPGRNYMLTPNWVDELSAGKVVPKGETPGVVEHDGAYMVH